MQPSKFLLNKIKRLLNCNGVEYEFTRMVENEYHELTEEDVLIIKGIYHEQNSYESLITSEGNVTHTKGSPQILCLHSDGINIKQGDTLEIFEKKYKVISVVDIQNYNIVDNISLEEVI